MADQSMRILQVSTTDITGGAAKVAWSLFQAYRARDLASWLAVGYKRSNAPDVLLIHNHRIDGIWSGFWWALQSRLQSLGGQVRGAWRLSHMVRMLADPRVLLDAYRGVEDFRFPGTWQILELSPQPPDILHCHNLHGGYFDLRALAWLSRQVPVVLTLHDAWLLSGHCGHSFDCERWRTGCGHCPDLTIYPSIRRDATAHNWRQKKDTYTKSCIYLATPSQWLMQKVEHSMLAPAISEARVIPNGVDLSVFHPGDVRAVRSALRIPQDIKVLLFTANGIRRNREKDYKTMRAAVAQVAERIQGEELLFIALGENAPAERIGRAEVRFVPYQKDPQAVARYYQSADLYVHAARADTFPNTVLEALACGVPVVATAVGGIPEQVKGLNIKDWGLQLADLNKYGVDEATGTLMAVGDAGQMANCIERLLNDELLRRQLSENAACDARFRFDLNRQVDEYLTWYQAIQQHSKSRFNNGQPQLSDDPVVVGSSLNSREECFGA